MRVIARIDIKNEYVIKGIHLEGLRKVGNPNALAVRYYNEGADEILFMDAVASLYGRNTLFDIVERACQDVFIPITVGGGIRTMEDIHKALKAGADKVAINTAAIKNPRLIQEASRELGSQSLIGSIEAKRVGTGGRRMWTTAGRKPGWTPWSGPIRWKIWASAKSWSLRLIGRGRCGGLISNLPNVSVGRFGCRSLFPGGWERWNIFRGCLAGLILERLRSPPWLIITGLDLRRSAARSGRPESERGREMMTVAILDYGCGNVRSISNALTRIRAKPVLTRDPRVLQEADALVIPGVGAFGNAMESLKRYRLVDEIVRFVDSGKCVLGICLGMQLLFEQSEEFGISRGLGLIRGTVCRLPVNERIRLPHIAWNTIDPPDTGAWKDSILSGVRPGSEVYFVHSYAPQPGDSRNILSWTTYGGCRFVSSVRAGRVFGCQFHPEKSRETGLLILREFVKRAEETIYARGIAGRPTNDGGVLRIAAASPVLREMRDLEPETQLGRRIQE